jgi:hypothetical protein
MTELRGGTVMTDVRENEAEKEHQVHAEQKVTQEMWVQLDHLDHLAKLVFQEQREDRGIVVLTEYRVRLVGTEQTVHQGGHQGLQGMTEFLVYEEILVYKVLPVEKDPQESQDAQDFREKEDLWDQREREG